jgi:hypothetical protein
MTRKELLLQKLALHPDGATANQPWEDCWGARADISHGVTPDDPWASLNSLVGDGKVIKLRIGKGSNPIVWKLSTGSEPERFLSTWETQAKENGNFSRRIKGQEFEIEFNRGHLFYFLDDAFITREQALELAAVAT